MKALAIFSVVVVLVGAPTFFAFSDFQLPNYNQGYMPEQPIPYSHKLHAGELGIECTYCHVGAEYGRHATIPSTSTCVNCHNGSACQGSTEEQKGWVNKLREYHNSNQPIEWVRIHNLPDYSYFNHSAHVMALRAEHGDKVVPDKDICATCHGPVDTYGADQVQQFAVLNMGWCVNCHRDKNKQSATAFANWEKLSAAEKTTNKQPKVHKAPLDCAACHR